MVVVGPPSSEFRILQPIVLSLTQCLQAPGPNEHIVGSSNTTTSSTKGTSKTASKMVAVAPPSGEFRILQPIVLSLFLQATGPNQSIVRSSKITASSTKGTPKIAMSGLGKMTG